MQAYVQNSWLIVVSFNWIFVFYNILLVMLILFQVLSYAKLVLLAESPAAALPIF